ncbi:MAG: hypothetical protein R6U50_16740 [Desulfobacterales bacterium]
MGLTKKKSEKEDDGFRFEVGAMYENMKGVYEVISIQNDSMLIRWEDGSEIVTSLDLQRRIIDRMAYENKLRQQEEVKSQGKAPKKPGRKT